MSSNVVAGRLLRDGTRTAESVRANGVVLRDEVSGLAASTAASRNDGNPGGDTTRADQDSDRVLPRRVDVHRVTERHVRRARPLSGIDGPLVDEYRTRQRRPNDEYGDGVPHTAESTAVQFVRQASGRRGEAAERLPSLLEGSQLVVAAQQPHVVLVDVGRSLVGG